MIRSNFQNIAQFHSAYTIIVDEVNEAKLASITLAPLPWCEVDSL